MCTAAGNTAICCFVYSFILFYSTFLSLSLCLSVSPLAYNYIIVDILDQVWVRILL